MKEKEYKCSINLFCITIRHIIYFIIHRGNIFKYYVHDILSLKKLKNAGCVRVSNL